MSSLDIERLREIVRARRDEFATARPFPHLVLDGLIRPEVAEALMTEFETTAGDWIYYHHVNERKRGFNDVSRMGPVSQSVVHDLNGAEFLGVLETLTGIGPLLADPELDGGGLQETGAGGFVNVHTDFLSHPTFRSWSRQVNLLLFLNKDWRESYNGDLELWDTRGERRMRSIAPTFNRCVIFRTDAASFHGVPDAVACPAERSRKALALYYFKDEGHPCALRATHYVPRPGDALMTRALIHADRWLLYGYAVLKRYARVDDRLLSKLLRRL